MAPFDGFAGHNRDSKNKSTLKLKLEFSKAADYARIDALFDPAVKHITDPHAYVVKRLDGAFRGAINSGAAVILSDQNNEVQGLTIAYRVNEDLSTVKGHPDFTEFGTAMARLPGYHSAQLIVAAIALREWYNHAPKQKMVAEIRNDNIPSVVTFRDRLGWAPVPDKAMSKRIFEVTDQTLADEKDKSNGADIDDLLAHAGWYECDAGTLAIQARILLTFLDQGGLLNKKTGDFIPVDMKALEQEGLTRARLEAIAKGETSRDRIRAIAP